MAFHSPISTIIGPTYVIVKDEVIKGWDFGIPKDKTNKKAKTIKSTNG